MAQFYKCFIKNFATIMAPITKFTQKKKNFMWIKECQKVWVFIKHEYIVALIFIPLN